MIESAARGGKVPPHYQSVIMLIAWRVRMYAFEGQILIVHNSYVCIEVSGGKHKRDEGEGGLEKGQQQ